MRLQEDQVVSCGRCVGCLLARGRDWTVRCMHELDSHAESWFLTLTYKDDSLVVNQFLPSLHPPHLQQFWKDLRKAIYPARIRFFACGEYGDRTQRPHYHAIVFGLSIPDRTFYSVRNGNTLYKSEWLNDLWGHGDVVIGDVTSDSVAYVCRYCLKKLHAQSSDVGYRASGRVPEYIVMSRRPGIGHDFYSRYYSQFLFRDSVSLSSSFSSRLPRYYDKLYSRFFSYLDSPDFVFSSLSILSPPPLDYTPESITARRVLAAQERFDESLPSRLASRRVVQEARLSRLPVPVH